MASVRVPSPMLPFPLLLIITLLCLHLFFCVALAASGGRMGGDSFHSNHKHSSTPSDHYDHHHHHHHHRFHHSSRSFDNSYTQHRPKENINQEGSDIADGDDSSPSPSSSWAGPIAFVGVVGAFSMVAYFQFLENKRSVLMVQVGLSGKARSLQRDLNEIAITTDTSSPLGWHHLLIETTLALLRHPDYFISGYASVKQTSSIESLEKIFKELSSEEREKFDMESMVNVNDVKCQRAVFPNVNKLGKDYIVVTILVAAQGVYKVPAIRSSDDLKDVLRSLNISSSKLLAVEVLWTPQDENDTLSEQELVENYPLLRPI